MYEERDRDNSDTGDSDDEGRLKALEAENERLRERLNSMRESVGVLEDTIESLEERMVEAGLEESDSVSESGIGDDSAVGEDERVSADRAVSSGEPSTSETMPRRGVMTGLASLGLLGLGSSAAAATSTGGGAHVGETWSGDPSADQLLRLDATGSTNAGLYATSESDSGKGLIAKAAGPNYTKGVLGLVASDKGTGVKGNAFSSSGNTEGVFGLAKSTSGTGVKGKASADSGFTKGVQGLAKSPDGRGVQGVAYSTSGENIGVRGETKSSTKNATGVKGHATASSGQTYGVEGETDSGDGAGVAGKLTTDSFSYPDLSENPSGVLGVTDRSTDDSTVFGPTGVLGLATASSGARVGVIGRTTSPGGVGILGVTQDNGGIGVYSAGNSVTGGDHIVNGTVARKSTSIAYASSDQSIPFGVETTVAFDSVDKDDFTTFDTENNEFVVPELGEYRVDFAVKWAEPLESGTEHEVIIRSSVAKDITFTRKTPTNGGSSVVHDTGSTVIPHLTAGDTISIVVRHDASSSVDLAGGRASTHVSFTHLG